MAGIADNVAAVGWTTITSAPCSTSAVRSVQISASSAMYFFAQ